MYIFNDVDQLEGKDKVGSKQCVALLQHYARLPNTTSWLEGSVVMGTFSVSKGTAIATFVNGRYQNNSTGNHAAFFISQDARGMWIMDQWRDNIQKPKVSKRYIRKQGRHASGLFVDPSNNAEAYSVIE